MGGFIDPQNNYKSKHYAQNQGKAYDYNLPKTSQTVLDGKRHHSILLTLFLFGIFGITSLFLVYLVHRFGELHALRGDRNIIQASVTEAQIILGFTFMLNCLQLIFIVALFNFKRWGYGGLAVGYLFSAILNLCGGSASFAIGNIIFLIVLSLLVMRIEPLLE
ncbi:MAG: hypothetical protein RLP44_16390 [Aggregatilineales bacterium]